MRCFHNDYHETCHQQVLDKLMQYCQCQMPGYGKDMCCERAAALIRKALGNDDAAIHFLTGGTQTNLTVIAASLRPHQAVIAPVSAHISEHETGAIEATGHKIISLPHIDGKITALQIETVMCDHLSDEGPERVHMPQPKMVYLSFPTEYGTLYSHEELTQIRSVCDKYGLYLYVDGARLGYGLAAEGNDVTLQQLNKLCDVFYIGGTKLGAMFAEAVVITNPYIAEDFRYIIKQRGGMLAKGWLMGLQFEAMFEDGLYYKLGKHGNDHADKIRETLKKLGYPVHYPSKTNQIFTTIPDCVLKQLEENFTYTFWNRAGEGKSVVRFCTSWSTRGEDVDALCAALARLS